MALIMLRKDGTWGRSIYLKSKYGAAFGYAIVFFLKEKILKLYQIQSCKGVVKLPIFDALQIRQKPVLTTRRDG